MLEGREVRKEEVVGRRPRYFTWTMLHSSQTAAAPTDCSATNTRTHLQRPHLLPLPLQSPLRVGHAGGRLGTVAGAGVDLALQREGGQVRSRGGG